MEPLETLGPALRPVNPPSCTKSRSQASPPLQWMARSLSSVTHRLRHPSAVGGPVGLLGSQPHSHRRNIGTHARCVQSLLSAPPAWRQGETSGWGARLIRGRQDPSPAQAHQELCSAGVCPQAAHRQVGMTSGSQAMIREPLLGGGSGIMGPKEAVPDPAWDEGSMCKGLEAEGNGRCGR